VAAFASRADAEAWLAGRQLGGRVFEVRALLWPA
jgi:hypothetical protein